MRYDVEVFSEQFPIVKRFLYHLTCYRELHCVYQGLNLQSEFWTHTIDAHLLQAVILWCMVFGSDGCNPTHWKKLGGDDPDVLQRNFRGQLSEAMALTQEQWKAYWEEINTFRGGYAAHRELNFSKPVPSLSLAEEVAYFYDKWVRGVIAPDLLDEPSLKESVTSMQGEIRPLAMHFLSATKLAGESAVAGEEEAVCEAHGDGVYWGDAIGDGRPHRGWFIGRFITDAMRQSTAVEVKFSTHEEPYCEEGTTANRTATSLAINISGACEYRFLGLARDKWISVPLTERGQYVIWEPGVLHSLRVEECCEMVVVRWPSIGRSDKVLGPDPWAED